LPGAFSPSVPQRPPEFSISHRQIHPDLDEVKLFRRAIRPAHAKGMLLTGVFTPSSEAASVTRAAYSGRFHSGNGALLVVQLAKDGDTIDDATVRWPEDRPQVTFGRN